MLKFLHILISLLYLPQVLSDDIFRPSAGELIPGNATYPVNWNITEYAGAGNTRIDGIYLAIPNMTPPYTSTFPVQARKQPSSLIEALLIPTAKQQTISL